MKMYCKIKRPDNCKQNIEKGEFVVIQEKIDGSNTAICNDDGNIRLFSRSQELKGQDGLGGFVKWIRQKEDKIKEFLPNGWVLYGEWLEQGKINYNSLAKQGKIEPYYAFDVASKIIPKQLEDDDYEREFTSIDIMQEIAKNIGLQTVPELEIIKFDNYDELKEKYVDNQKSALEGTDCIREGIVIKTLNGKKRIKIVADSFKEVKQVKSSETKSPFAFIDKYITPARIRKFLTEIQIETPTQNDYKEIFKNLDTIAEDILTEEKEQILKEVLRIIKKQAVPNIKEYVDSINQSKVSEENEKNNSI